MMSMQYEERNFFMYVLYYTYLSPGNLGGHLGSCHKGASNRIRNLCFDYKTNVLVCQDGNVYYFPRNVLYKLILIY